MKGSLVIASLFITVICNSQINLTLKPDSICGKDAIICNSPNWNTGPAPNITPAPSKEWLRVEAWTANSAGSAEHDWRTLIEFTKLKSIKSAGITSATLRLYAYPGFPFSNGGQAESNASEVYRIIEPWTEEEVVWINQPAFDNNQRANIPRNNNYDLIDVDVTALVQTMINEANSSFGFLLKQVNENPYGSMDFSSSDHPNSDWHPELIILAENIEYFEEMTTELFSASDTSFCTDSPIVLNPLIDPNQLLEINWSTGESEFSITIEEAGLYWVDVKLDNCISLSDSILIEEIDCSEIIENCDLFIPNIFSPNNDGLNDFFSIITTDQNCVESFNLNVYDRSGNFIFHTNDINESWDGKFNGREVRQDVYSYLLNYKFLGQDSESITKSGSISLVR